MGRKKNKQNKPKAAQGTPPPATAEGLQQAMARKDRASLRILCETFYNTHQHKLALQALDALEALGDQDPILTKKRAQIFIKYGEVKRAIAPLQRFLETAPDDIQAKGLLAEALYQSNKKEAAVELLREFVAHCPDDDKAKGNLAIWLEETGRRDEAEELLATLITKAPDHVLHRLYWPLVALERIPASEAVHQAMLERFMAHIADVRDWAKTRSEAERRSFPHPYRWGPFALAYYPGDITPYLRAWGEMLATLYPPTPVPHPPVRERVRLVLFSRQLYRQSVWMILLRTLIAKLDTRFFELVVMSQVTSEDDQTAWLKERCARYYGMRPGGWEDLLQREAPDVLFLPDTAMNNVSVGVAARRFAPLQVTTWRHPVSSGLQTVDLYLSGTDLEPPDAATHYIERLVRLPGTGACTPNLEMTPAPLPEALTTHFADGRPVALVPCNAFKLVPADDSLWVRLAQTYPTLKLLFFRQSHYGRMGTAPLERIRAALTAAGVDVTQQMFVLEFQPFQVFATLLSRATLYLDVPSFSGYTTAWQGVFAGIPIVTLKGRFLRQRLAAGLLETIGCADTVVENLDAYIAKVGELIEEWQQRPEAYAARRARIQAAAPLACNDVRVVRGFERVLLEELAERGNPTALALLPQHRAAYPDYHYEREQGCVVAPPRQDTPNNGVATQLPVTAEGLKQAIERKDRASLRTLSDAFHHAHQPELALQALDALEALGDNDPILIKKRAQIFIKYGEANRAIAPLQRFLETAPEDMQAKGLLAEALYLSGNKEAGVEVLRSVVAHCPDDDKAKENLVMWLEETGRRDEAEELLATLIAKAPDHVLCRLQWPLVALEGIPSNEAVHQAMLERFMAHIADVQDWARTRSEAERQSFPPPNRCGPFALAYYPGDITPYLRAWGEMLATLYPPTPIPHPPARERVRLVILSAQFYRQSVWMILLHSLIEKLDTRFFELVAISLAPSEDDQTAWLKERCARYYGMRPGGWEDLLQREAPDVLFLPDTTMNNVSVGVAARRFAPLQVTTWGHPVSSGLQTVDLYFSGTALEPPDAASHYIERLVRLPGTGACTSYLEVVSAPLPETLTALFADNRPVALVPCMSFKLVPADDSLWVRLAQTYPTLKLLFFRQSDFGRMGTAPLERITAALTAAGVDVTQQMVVLEFQPPQVFTTLLSRATLYLDVPSFSGYTTAWQGVFAGIPIVTLKGRFLRQRLAAGLLETIGCADTVVENLDAYIAKVGELIEEWQQRPEAYAARRARIQAAAPLACNDVRVVRGFERVLLEELAERGNPTALALLPQHRATYPDYHYEREQGCVVAPPRQDTPDKSAVAEPLATPCLQELPISSSSESDAPPSQFAPTPVHGLMPPTTPSPPGATSVSNPATPGNATPPVWRLLDQDLHLTTLSHTYAPVGLLQMIPAAPRAVFDLGCFVGATGRWLKGQFPGVRVVGVELLPAAAEKARADYDQVFTGRFEEIDLAPLTGQFDTIIAADVLEHLYHPWQSLERLKTLLAPGGALYVSLPNVRNLRVLEGLALGDWPYAGAGILDITHLRFFTRRSALRMLSETGWQVQDVRANLDPQLKGMIEGRDLGAVRHIELKNLVLRNLPPGETVEFFTLQWFIRAVPQ